METYEQCLESFRSTDDSKVGVFYLVESITFQKGLEGPFELIKYYYKREKHELVCMYYNAIQNINDHSVFYHFSIPYYVASSAIHMNNIELACTMFIRIFKHKFKMKATILTTMLAKIKNVLPFVNSSFLSIFHEYLQFVKKTYSIVFDYIPKHTNSILFCVADSGTPWNYTYGFSHAIGGSEQAIRYITQHFPEYTVYVCGNVIEEVVGNVHYVKEKHLGKLIMSHFFKAIVLSRNISFLEMYQNHYADRILLMAHDTELYGVPDIHATLKKWLPSIKACVCLTNFHKNLFQEKYPYLPITIIQNGIEPSLFIEKPKISNRFLFTSRPERGLEKLLELWPFILKQKPDATLVISSYQPFTEEYLKMQMKRFSSIKHVGQLSPNELYDYMATAEYWLFPSTFLETSCITAMEMMASNVKCYYYPEGGIVETMNGHGIPIIQGNELLFETYSLDSAKQYALSCSWKNRAIQWKTLFEPTILNLIIYNPIDHEPAMKQVQDTYIHTFPFVNSFFITFRKQKQDIVIEGDMVYVNGVENHFHITKKTFDFFKLNPIYDYLYRTNISTITNFHELFKQLPVMYAGDKRHVYNVAWEHGYDNKGTLFGLPFVQGTNIVLHKKAVHHIVNDTQLHELETIYEDDLVIAYILQKYQIKPTILEPFMFRHKTDNRYNDIIQMKQSVQKSIH